MQHLNFYADRLVYVKLEKLEVHRLHKDLLETLMPDKLQISSALGIFNKIFDNTANRNPKSVSVIVL